MERAMLHYKKPGHGAVPSISKGLSFCLSDMSCNFVNKERKMHSTCLNTIYTLSSIVMRILFLGFAPPYGRDYTLMQDLGIKFLA
jgi:hypothetical protein